MAVNYNPRSVTNGLVLHIDPSNPRSYPGNGTTIFDMSGNGNNGTLTNMNVPACYVRTYGGRALDFDGVNDRVAISNSSSLQIIGPITIAFWLNITNNGGVSEIISKSTGADGEYEIFADFRSGGTVITWRPGVGGGSVNNFFLGYTDVWVHVAATCDKSSIGANVTYYRNGVFMGKPTTNTARVVSNYGVNLASRAGAGSLYANAQLDDIRIYNRELSQAEILQNYNATRGRFGV